MSSHVVPQSVYLKVFWALMVLTVVTVAVSLVDLGPLNVVVALLVAGVKATLVVLFFMHVRYSPKLIWIFAGAGFLWLLFMLVLTFQDVATRDWIPVPPL